VRNLLTITGDWQKFKGLSGTEGTLKVGEQKADKKVRYDELVKESLAIKEAKAATRPAKAAARPRKEAAAEAPAEAPAAEAPAEAAAPAETAGDSEA
jgi:small subunit ribosomal protein S16